LLAQSLTRRFVASHALNVVIGAGGCEEPKEDIETFQRMR
jgi:hypothetical protein